MKWLGIRILHFKFIIASVIRKALKLSEALWTLKMEAPNSRQYEVRATVGHSLSYISLVLSIFEMNDFLEAPIMIGLSKDKRYLTDFNKSKLCSVVFPNPMPGSKIILSLLIPFSSHFFNCWIKNVMISLTTSE